MEYEMKTTPPTTEPNSPDHKRHQTLVQENRFNPLDFSLTTALPERYSAPEPSAWIGHVPFAMTLIEMLLPATVVELGTHVGISYSAFCQAVSKLNLPTKCWAIDTWQGDAHTGAYSNHIHDELRRHHDPRYASFSTLLRSTFNEARSHFTDGTVDLLHIDGYHSYEAVENDFITWLPKMSTRGIVLFHDTALRDHESFGVWRLWDKLSKQHPNFEFDHAHGLGVLSVGSFIPTKLVPLFQASPDDATRIRRHFQGLGKTLEELQNRTLTQRENFGRKFLSKLRRNFRNFFAASVS
jgi:hypothetical protein